MSVPGTHKPPATITSLLPMADFKLGEVLPGSRYRIIAQIGKGGMGAVYEAEHIDLQKRVAIKVLLASARDGAKVAAFLKEARTASRITSRYIADVTDFGELSDGRVYFVMQYIEGHSLGRQLRLGEHFGPQRVIPILRQIAKGLAATHDKNVVHLDVKPDNIMLTANAARPDTVMMVDFGIAGLLQDARAGARTISGTPEYVSPERIQAKPYDRRSDVYSLGVVGYELLTGVVPFRGSDPVATLRQHIEEAVPPMVPRVDGVSIPQSIENVIAQLLAKDPNDRPQDMAVVEALLCEAQINGHITTPWDDLELPFVEDKWRKSLAERMPSPAGLKRKKIAIASTIVAVVAGGLALYLGVIRAPQVIIKEVMVAVTKTEEAAQVAAYLVRAGQALRRQHYVTPLGQSALDHIERAEAQAKTLNIRSPGAQILRESSGAALLAMGREMAQVDLHDLALIKYREALRFLPDDDEVKAKAQLTPEEAQVFADRRAWEDGMTKHDASAKKRHQARKLAADLFQSARNGADSQARLTMKRLQELDDDGEQQAQLADGLRRLAKGAWGTGKVDKARSMYKVIAGLDPEDKGAVVRATEPDVALAAAPDPKDKARGPEPVAKTKTSVHRPISQPVLPDMPLQKVDRDAQSAAELVTKARALARSVKLKPAEKLFEQAISADPHSHAAFGGLAEVYFEQARYEEALSYVRKASRLAPGAASYQVLHGDCLYKLFRFPQALKVWQKAQVLEPNRGEIGQRIEDVKKRL